MRFVSTIGLLLLLQLLFLPYESFADDCTSSECMNVECTDGDCSFSDYVSTCIGDICESEPYGAGETDFFQDPNDNIVDSLNNPADVTSSGDEDSCTSGDGGIMSLITLSSSYSGTMQPQVVSNLTQYKYPITGSEFSAGVIFGFLL